MYKAAILLLTLTLSSCVVVPVEETVSVLVSGLSHASASLPDYDAPCTLRYPLHTVCIEYNQDVAIPDFIPTIQNRLKKLQVESAIYAPGNMPYNCKVTLRYTALRGWKNRVSYGSLFSYGSLSQNNEMLPYLTEAQLILLESGMVIASSRYQFSDSSYDARTTTAYKMNPVINDLVCKKTDARLKNDSDLK